jgi:hypothetical protein
MAIGTAFTLFFVPAIYLLIARDRHAERQVEREPGTRQAVAALDVERAP